MSKFLSTRILLTRIQDIGLPFPEMGLITPSTPKAQVTPVATFTPSPGTWRHPKFDEITRRQNATTFSYNNVRKIIWNSGALAAVWFARGFVNARYGIKTNQTQRTHS